MKKAIWKFPLEVVDVQDIEMPKGSVLLSVQTQNNAPYLWALANPEQTELETVSLRTICTGEQFLVSTLNSYEYLDTYQILKNEFVGHVFKRKN